MLSAPLQVPFFFKHAIDALSIDPTGAATANYLGLLQLTPVALMMGYGIARAGAAFCGELRNVVFAKVSQSVIRGMAKQVCMQQILWIALGWLSTACQHVRLLAPSVPQGVTECDSRHGPAGAYAAEPVHRLRS
jgi:hypothetical protein